MRIWHLTKSLTGGAGQYALRLSQALAAAGHQSVVLVPEPVDVEGASALVRTHGRIAEFFGRGLRSVARRIASAPYHSLHGWETYRPSESLMAADVIHLHGMSAWIGVRGLRRLLSKDAVVFQTTHAPWDISGGCVLQAGSQCQGYERNCGACPVLSSPWKCLARWNLSTRRKFVRDFSVRAIANGDWMASLIPGSSVYQGQEVPVVPPIVDNEYLRDGIPELRGELDLPPRNRVLCVGCRSITDPFKGIEEFLSRLAQQRDLRAQTTVLVFGEGNMPAPSDLDVRFMGIMEDASALASIYRASDLFVSPSKIETFGMTLVEAQAVGTPICGFDVGGVRNAVMPAHHTNLVMRDEWASLFDRIRKSLVDPIGMDEKKALRVWARQRFSAEAAASIQERCYASALEARAA